MTNKHKKQNRVTPAGQSGAALVVGLILLVVVTVLAVSGMSTATTELAMARNDQNYENAFQAAETGLEQAIAQGQFNTAGQPVIVFPVNANDSVSLDLQYEDPPTIVPPDADNGAYSVDSFRAYHFLATSTADSKRAGTAGAVTDRDASAIHTQAFYKVGPKPADAF